MRGEDAIQVIPRTNKTVLDYKGFWENLVDQDMKQGKADIFAIQSFISHFIIGNADNRKALSVAQSFEGTPPGAMAKFLNYGDMEMKDATALT